LDPYYGWDDHQPFLVSIDHGSYGGFHKWGYSPKMLGLFHGKSQSKNGFRSTPILGNFQIPFISMLKKGDHVDDSTSEILDQTELFFVVANSCFLGL
jgi:hypothetical protein